MKKGNRCNPTDGECSAITVYDDSKCGSTGCSGPAPAPAPPAPAPPPAPASSGVVPHDTAPWYCRAQKPYTIPPLYKGLFKGSDVNSGAKVTDSSGYNFIIRFEYACPPTVQFSTLFRSSPPYDQATIDNFISVYCNNECGTGSKSQVDIVSWNTGGGVAPNWGGKETAYLKSMFPILVQLGYNGITLDIEYFDRDFTTGMIEDLARSAKTYNFHFCITVMGWGPEPGDGVVSWADLDFTNIDLFVPQCYGAPGITYDKDSVSSPEKLCKYWTEGYCPDPKGCRAGFIPCKVPPKKLAAGLGCSVSLSSVCAGCLGGLHAGRGKIRSRGLRRLGEYTMDSQLEWMPTRKHLTLPTAERLD